MFSSFLFMYKVSDESLLKNMSNKNQMEQCIYKWKYWRIRKEDLQNRGKTLQSTEFQSNQMSNKKKITKASKNVN